MELSEFVCSNKEIADFIARNKDIITKASKDAGVRECDRMLVVEDLAIKFGQGKLVFDPSRGVKESTFMCRVAYNAGCTMARAVREVELKEKEWNVIPDRHAGTCGFSASDIRLLVKEALNRLARECEKRKVELLVRYVLLEEDRDAVARAYGETPDNVSLIKTRWLPRLKAHLKDAIREDEAGKLVLSPNRIDFLKPLLKWR